MDARERACLQHSLVGLSESGTIDSCSERPHASRVVEARQSEQVGGERMPGEERKRIVEYVD